jgi:hypothetical protein
LRLSLGDIVSDQRITPEAELAEKAASNPNDAGFTSNAGKGFEGLGASIPKDDTPHEVSESKY